MISFNMVSLKVKKLHRMHFLVAGIIAIIFVITFSISTNAQQLAQINMQVSAGFENSFKDGQWIPVKIILENNGPDVNGKVIAQFSGSGPEVSRYSYLVDLPSVSRKEITLYVFPSIAYATQLKITLYDSLKPVLEDTINLKRLNNSDLLTGVIAANPAVYNIFSLLDPPNGTSSVEVLNIQDLPELVQGYSALDNLVLSAVDTGELTDKQISALTQWTSWGGQLIITGGPDWQKTISGLENTNILPFLPASSSSIQGNELQDFLDGILAFSGSSQTIQDSSSALIISTGNIEDGSEITLTSPGPREYPIIIQKPIGIGRVTYLTFDPSIPPFSGWVGTEDLFRTLTFDINPKPAWSDGFLDWSLASQAAQTVPSLSLPSILLICGFLFLYVASIGPANYFLLRYLRRRELGWISIPVLVIFFSILVFITGNISRGQKPISQRLSVVQIWDDNPNARVDGVMGIYSPYRATYEIIAQENTVLHAIPNNSSPQIDEPEIIQDGKSFLMPGLRVDVGGVYPLAYQSSMEAPKLTNTIKLVVNETGTTLLGTIDNFSNVNLTDIVILTQGSVLQLGDLKVGEQIEVDQLLDTVQTGTGSSMVKPGSLNPSVGFNPSVPIYAPTNMIEQILGTYDYYQNRETFRKYSILAAAMGYTGSVQQTNEVYVIGWDNQSVVDIDIKNANENSDNLTLYIVSINPEVEFEGSNWNLSPGFFRWSSNEPQRTDIGPYNVYLYSSTSYDLEFTPIRNISFSQVESLTFRLLNPYQSGEVNSALFFLWNYEEQEWNQIENLTWGENLIESPENFVATKNGRDDYGDFSPGTIRLKVSSNSDYLEINTSDFTLSVTP